MLAVLLAVASLIAAFFAVQPVRRSLADWRERRTGEQAAKLYERCWLGIWHAEDEAIGGLRSSLGSVSGIVPRTTRVTRLVGPVLDQVVWALLIRRTAHGADLLGAALSRVTTEPLPFQTPCAELRSPVAGEMAARSQQRIGPMVAGIRQLLGRGYLTGDSNLLLDGVKRQFDFRTLIHNSYFEEPAVRE
jgi:hypothetical protein